MTAGPNERAGLMMQPSMGMRTNCATKTAKPMAMIALFPQVLLGLTAVSQTTVGDEAKNDIKYFNITLLNGSVNFKKESFYVD